MADSAQQSQMENASDFQEQRRSKEVQLCPDDPLDLHVDEDAAEKSSVASGEEPEKLYRGWRLVFVTSALMALVLMIALDNYILATAIPRISNEFRSLGSVGWYASSYFLTQTAFQPGFGRLFSSMSIKWLSVATMIIFEIGSLICATAPSSAALIIGRLVSGAGGAGLYVAVLAMLPCIVPIDKRPLYLSLITMMFGVASIAGPLLGGVFTDSQKLKWRFCFWINLPIGFVAISFLILSFRDPPKSKRGSLNKAATLIDVASIATFLGSFICFIFATQWGGLSLPWSNPSVWGCLLGFGLLLIAFFAIQFVFGTNASMPLSIITQRTVAGSCSFILFTSMCVGILIYYLPIFFQAGWGEDAQSSAFSNLPFLITMLFTPILSGALISLVTGYYVPFMWFGAIFTAIGSGLLHSVPRSNSKGQLDGYQFLAGLGLGICTQVPFSAVQAVLPADTLVHGSSLVSFCNSLGPVLGTNIAQAVFVNRLVTVLKDVPNIEVATVIQTGATNPSAPMLPVVREAFTNALARAFLVPTVCGSCAFACSLVMERVNIRRRA